MLLVCLTNWDNKNYAKMPPTYLKENIFFIFLNNIPVFMILQCRHLKTRITQHGIKRNKKIKSRKNKHDISYQILSCILLPIKLMQNCNKNEENFFLMFVISYVLQTMKVNGLVSNTIFTSSSNLK